VYDLRSYEGKCIRQGIAGLLYIPERRTHIRRTLPLRRDAWIANHAILPEPEVAPLTSSARNASALR
jgi:hypothetical protein